MTRDNIIPAGHEGFRVEANERSIPMTGPLGLVESTDGQIIGRLALIWPPGVAREKAELTLRDMYATAMHELDKAEAARRQGRKP